MGRFVCFDRSSSVDLRCCMYPRHAVCVCVCVYVVVYVLVVA
jgi:hypothetical protein